MGKNAVKKLHRKRLASLDVSSHQRGMLPRGTVYHTRDRGYTPHGSMWNEKVAGNTAITISVPRIRSLASVTD